MSKTQKITVKYGIAQYTAIVQMLTKELDRLRKNEIDGTIKSKAKDVLANHGLTISDFMPLTTVAHDGLPKYYSIPNRQLKNSIQEVIDDLSGKEKLPEAGKLKELDQLFSSDNALESSK